MKRYQQAHQGAVKCCAFRYILGRIGSSPSYLSPNEGVRQRPAWFLSAIIDDSQSNTYKYPTFRCLTR